MGQRSNYSAKLMLLQSDLAEEIAASLEASIANIEVAMRGNDPQLLRRVKSELISAKNIATLLANSLKSEPQAIKRENVVPLRAAE